MAQLHGCPLAFLCAFPNANRTPYDFDDKQGQGQCCFASLLPGMYSITVEAPGFKKFEHNNMAMKLAGNIRIIVRQEVCYVKDGQCRLRTSNGPGISR